VIQCLSMRERVNGAAAVHCSKRRRSYYASNNTLSIHSILIAHSPCLALSMQTMREFNVRVHFSCGASCPSLRMAILANYHSLLACENDRIRVAHTFCRSLFSESRFPELLSFSAAAYGFSFISTAY